MGPKRGTLPGCFPRKRRTQFHPLIVLLDFSSAWKALAFLPIVPPSSKGRDGRCPRLSEQACLDVQRSLKERRYLLKKKFIGIKGWLGSPEASAQKSRVCVVCVFVCVNSLGWTDLCYMVQQLLETQLLCCQKAQKTRFKAYWIMVLEQVMTVPL